MIAYKFPPMHNTSCVRTWGFYRHIRPWFEDVLVLSTTNRHKLRQEPVDMDGVRVFDADTLDYRTLLQGDKGRQSVLKDQRKESAVGRFGQKLSASFPTMYLFGEGGIRYINHGFRIGRQLVESQGVTHIFSTFSPYADHVIAYRLKKRFPHLYWIADFRDLHVDPTQDNMLFRNYQKQYNREILSIADCVTTVSDGLAEHLEEFNSNIYVLRNGIEELPDDGRVNLYNKFTISYTGSMYGDKRDPRPLLQALSELLSTGEMEPHEVALRYAGKDSEVWRRWVSEFGLDEIFYDDGLLSRVEALDLQRRSHINLLLTYSSNELTGNITGKVFEYMRALRPIFMLINGPADTELEELVRDLPGGVYYPGDGQELKEDLREHLYLFRQGRPWFDKMRSAVEPFQWANTIEDFAEHIGLEKIHAV